MTLNGCEFDKPCEGDPAVLRDATAGYFVKLGYELKGRTDKRVHLKFDGSFFGTNPETHSHHVYVTAKPGAIHFEFSTGIVASYWTEKDVVWASGRADAAVRAAQGHLKGADYRSAEEPMDPCPYCGKINVRTLPACTACGAPRA